VTTQLGRALAIASEAFQHTTDRGGHPYMLHCLHVMYQMPENDQDLRIIAVLHDLIEDSPTWTWERLLREGFSDRVLTALKLLTHDKTVAYDDYIEAIAGNFDAVRVKRADLRHNSDITRMKGLRPKDLERIAKYHRAYARLRDIAV
jgi:(p)ppGpp synthase/HD superfamily hydrolase